MNDFSILDQIESNLIQKKIGIEEFAESTKFCNKILYPKQRLLLKIIFLEELSDLENRWLDEWIESDEVTISPDIRERMKWCKDHGYPHFREIILVGGRRSSKGFVTGLVMGKKMYDCLQLQDPNQHYGIDANKEIYFTCVAASEKQAKELQYADLSSTVNSCAAMQDYIAKYQELEFSLHTEADLRRLEEFKRQKRRVQRDISKLRGRALASNSRTIRGYTSMGIVFDEMAFFMQGDSDQADDAVYDAAIPSLAQFNQDGILFCNPPEAPVWMADLSFKPIGDIEIGDKVVGWDRPEHSPTRKLKESVVENVIRRTAPIVKVTMESGRTFRCTEDHRWLTASSSINNEIYAPAKVGRNLVHVVDPTPSISTDLERDVAWLAGLFDGEGHASDKQQVRIAQSRHHNPKVCDEIERILDLMNIVWVYDEWEGDLGPGGCYRLLGGSGAGARQLYTNLANWWNPVKRQGLIDKVIGKGRWRTKDRVVAIEPDGEGEVVALTTSTVNYVCNGYASRNCNSSPYTKVGKFYERFQESQSIDQDLPTSPMMFGIQFPSWAMFEGWWEDPMYSGLQKCVTVSPDWDLDRKTEEGYPFYTADDRMAIEVERANERDNPVKFKVERRAQWAEVVDSYLDPEMVDRMYLGRPTNLGQGFEALRTNFTDSTYMHRYKAHLDPSSTTAGFGFALGHTELLKVLDPEGIEIEQTHVVFDIVKRWKPQEFPNGVIDWELVIKEVLQYCDIFRPYEVTFDQFQSAAPIQEMNRVLRTKGMSDIRVYEKTATAQHNWERAETFKTALYQNLVHSPYDTEAARWSAEELKYLQEIRTGRLPRVEKQDVGPVRTKDIADCIMEVTEGLIGNLIAAQQRADLSIAPSYGAPGGYPLGGHDREGTGTSPFADLYTRRIGEQTGRGSRFMGEGSARRPGSGRGMSRNPARGRGFGR